MSNYVYIAAPSFIRARHWAEMAMYSPKQWIYVNIEHRLRGVNNGILFIVDSTDIRMGVQMAELINFIEYNTDILVYRVHSESIRQQKARADAEANPSSGTGFRPR